MYRSMIGTGTAAGISVSPTSYNFGNVVVGSSSGAQTFTVTNTGTANLIIGTITLTGTDPTQFSKQNDNCSGHTIAPSGTCTVQAVFSPTSAGGKSANLSIPSNAPTRECAVERNRDCGWQLSITNKLQLWKYSSRQFIRSTDIYSYKHRDCKSCYRHDYPYRD